MYCLFFNIFTVNCVLFIKKVDMETIAQTWICLIKCTLNFTLTIGNFLMKKPVLHKVKTAVSLKRADDALPGIENLYQTLAESSPDMIYLVDADGVIQYINLRAAQAFGQTPADLIGKRTDMAFPQEIARHYMEEIDLVVTTKKQRVMEILEQFPTGARWISTRLVPITGPGREVIQILGISTDVTERKQAEMALRENEEKYHTIADFTYDWEFWIAPDGIMIYNSPTCERITGYRSDEFINNPGLLQEIIYLEDQSLVGNHFHTTDSGDPHEVDFRIVTRSGETVWIGHSCQAVYGEDGRWLGRRVSNRDITERKRAEELLNIASAYNRSLIEINPDPLVTISAEGRITDVNNTTERFTGCSRDELIGTDFSDYFTDAEKARAGYQQVLRDGSVKDYELELRHKNGQAISVMYNASVYRDESGKIMGIFAAARDITDLKNAERNLLELNQNLEDRVAERSAELTATNQQLLREIAEHSGTASSLRESEQRMKMVIESSPVGIFVIQDEKYTFANQAFVKIFGLTDNSDVIGKQLETLYDADSGKKISDIVRQCVDRSEMINVNELKALTRDEQSCHLNIWIQPIKTWGSSALMGFIVDISEEVEFRSHLNKSQKMEALGLSLIHI